MKKIALVLIAFVTLLQIVIAEPVEKSSTFEIRAYRIDPTKYMTIEITDALPSRYSLVGNGEILDFTEYLTKYIGQVTESETEEDYISLFSEHVIFSYRVAGNDAGTYSIQLTFNPFSDGNGQYVSAFFEIGNISYIYSQTNNDETSAGERIYETVNSDGSENETVSVDSTNTSGTIKKTWIVEADDLEWVARGAIGLNIDETTYKNASNGTYSSPVTVKLESQS